MFNLIFKIVLLFSRNYTPQIVLNDQPDSVEVLFEAVARLVVPEDGETLHHDRSNVFGVLKLEN